MFTDYLAHLAPRTQKDILETVNHLLNWLAKNKLETSTVKHHQLIQYVAQQQTQVKASTLKNRIRAYKYYFEYLKQQGEILHNPITGITLKNQETQQEHYLKEEELESLYQNYQGKKRHKIMLGFIINQAADQGTLSRINQSDLNLDECTIYLKGSRKSNARKLSLKANQMLPIMQYQTQHQSEQLFTHSLTHELQFLLKDLKQQNPKVQSIRQLRGSTIVNWLKKYNKREVQYYCGYRYISSVEKYEIEDPEELKNQLEQSHPFA